MFVAVKRWWILLGIVSAFVILVVMIPARAYSMILENYGTHLLATKGTIWYGSGEVHAAGKNIGRLEWQVYPSQIFGGRLAFKVSMQNSNISLSGVITRGFFYTDFQGAVSMEAALVNFVLLPYEVHVQGQFALQDLLVKMNDQRQMQVLQGTLTWDGGLSRYRTNNETRVFEMPPVMGKLSHEDGFAVLNAQERTKKISLIEARFRPESGLFKVALTHHMLELSQMPWESAMDASEVVLEVSRELY